MHFTYFKRLISKRKREILNILVAVIVTISSFFVMSYFFCQIGKSIMRVLK